ncbi:hypothetical protein E1B28_005331 [Marasmius oreades]|uniref:beta-glucosidase n=1 Tax=Marasmius oreades TaxID=181124 RepID=A0A9P7UU53_9AGAR|nr:uncharacterized protein E1B28_005331 [Marasmius oreades]KAG7094502.1 hypothetical protein E1B28_005331 [Marasmius oreades]
MVPLWLVVLPLALAQPATLSFPGSQSQSSSTSESLSASNPASTTPTSTFSSISISVSISVSTSITASASSNSALSSPSGSTISVSSNSTTGSTAPTSTAINATTTTHLEPPATSSAIVTRKTVPIHPYTFEPFPVPSQPSIPGVFPDTDPRHPPEVGAPVVPNFERAWAAAYRKAQGKIVDLSLEEKVNVTTGVGWMGGRCVGNIPDVGDFPGLCLEDSPLGVRFGDFATGFPAGINAAATWNRDLIRARGIAMGAEFVGKGVNIALGPMMNMGRVAQGGRNWEGFGADPFLTGESAYETILGMQQSGVQACAKHYIFNEQEHKRTQSSSIVDDRTAHEIYAHPFLRSVMAGVASVMCSYNLINGTYACEDDKTMNDILKREYAFQGFIMSDWQATMSTISAITGLDMTMPGDVTFNSGDSYFGGNLTAYVNNGTIPEARVDDMATRIIAGWYLLHQDAPSYPQVNFDAFKPDNEPTNDHIDVQDDHADVVRKIGAASTILLKNENGALPLTGRERRIFLAGSDGGPPKIGPNRFSDQGGLEDGILAMGWGSGTANFTYLISPYEAIQQRARKHRTTVSWSFDDFDLPRAGNMAIKQSAALVFIASDSGEQYINFDQNEGDRRNLTAWHGGDDLVLAVAAQNNNTIVIVNSVGPLIVEPWIEHPNVTAVLWAGLQGNEAGNAIADVLYGDWNPSGRLPYTIAKRLEDYSTGLVLGGGPQDILAIPYEDGLQIDYRHFDANNIEPRFEFGFGLSYTDFEYSDLRIERVPNLGGMFSENERAWDQGKVSPIAVGSSTAIWLHRPAFKVSFNIRNVGGVYGGEVPQVYLNFPRSSGEPPSVLRGFTNTAVQPGWSKRVEIVLSRYDASIWDVEAQGWRKPNGRIGVTVGRSSRDKKLNGHLPV